MRALWATWGPLLVLLALRVALPLVVVVAYKVVHAYLDRRIPDDLPLAAGDWAWEQSAALGLGLSVVVRTGAGSGAFNPPHRRIELPEETYLKRDPAFWATAAHELGHALLHQRQPGLAWLLYGYRRITDWAGRLAILFLVGALVYGSALALIARVLLGVHIFLCLVVVAEEVDASRRALQLLRQDGRVVGARMVSAYASLASALATYLAHLAARVALFAGWDAVATAVAGRQVVPAAPLAGAAVWVAGGLCVLLALNLAVAVWLVRDPVAAPAVGVSALIAAVLVIPLLLLVWRQPLSFAFRIACVLGLGVAMPLLRAVAIAAVLLVFAVLRRLFGFALRPLARLSSRLAAGLLRGEPINPMPSKQILIKLKPERDLTALGRVWLLGRVATVVPLLVLWLWRL